VDLLEVVLKRVTDEYILQGLGFGAMPTQIICTDELRDGSIVPIQAEWSAFYEAACEIIVENTARA
jgi:hypothetical protein